MLLKYLVFALCVQYGIAQQGIDFGNLVNNFIQGDGLRNIQNMYGALPAEFKQKLMKDFLANPNKVGQDMLNLIGPQFQNILTGIIGNLGNGNSAGSNKIEDENESVYSGDKGFDLSSIGSMVGNLISTNPQMLISMAQGLFQENGLAGINFESITNMITEKLDFDTILSMASTLGLDGSRLPRGEGGDDLKATLVDALKLNQVYNTYQSFMKSPMGKKLNYLLPRLFKAKTLPDALRLLEKETSIRFDTILMQLKDKTVRRILVKQMIQPATNFLKKVKIPSDMKQLVAKADDLLNNKLKLDITVNWIEPIILYIKDRFKISRDSLMDLKPEDIEAIIHELLNDELFEPLSVVLDVHAKAKENYQCREFIFCQLNYNYYDTNFIRRNIIKFSSIATAFQVKRNDNDFVQIYNSIYSGNDGKDCTMGVSSFCLELMETASHNEL